MADRIALQQFQDELARKLAAVAQRPQAVRWLGVSWQGVRALLPLAQAGEISQPMPLQRLPHTQPWVVGVASLRGVLTLVVDWVQLLDVAGDAQGSGSEQFYWVSLNADFHVGAALCVDQLLGLHTGQAWQVAAVPQGMHPAIRQIWHDEQGQPWYELDLQAVVDAPAFQDPGASGFPANPEA
ncbi:MAG TPA: chemotaxis protein CheW [Macromonas sp.]|nr:chemotaxis protein CheW [Macromonas sp.]